MSDAHSSNDESGGGSNFFVDAIFWILFAVVLFSVLKGVLNGLHISFDFLPSMSQIFSTIFGPIQVLSVFVSLLFLIGIIYYNIKLSDLLHSGGHHGDHHTDEHSHDDMEVHNETKEAIAHHHPSEGGNDINHSHNKRWDSVTSRINSFSESDWKLAIIEADVILDDMLTRMGYHGEGVGEKLKTVEKSDFDTLEFAWEAHKVRNRIAHDGPLFKIDHSEAKRVIGLYQKVFEEFYFI